MTTLSIVIPTLNAEAFIHKLILRLNSLAKGIKFEIIIIDSDSNDSTKQKIDRLMGRYPIRFYKIKRNDFNHGTTRNFAVSLSKGKYICFVSQDALPATKDAFKFFLRDLGSKNKVVAAFAKDTPAGTVAHFLKLEYLCRYRSLDRIAKGNPLVQSKNDIDQYRRKINYYGLSNVFSCYKKSFLSKNPFPKADFGEDLLLGKIILEKGFAKLYDPRIKVIHYQRINLWSYYLRQKSDLKLRLDKMKINDSPQILCKLRNIFSEKSSLVKKAYYTLELGVYYLIKAAAYLNG